MGLFSRTRQQHPQRNNNSNNNNTLLPHNNINNATTTTTNRFLMKQSTRKNTTFYKSQSYQILILYISFNLLILLTVGGWYFYHFYYHKLLFIRRATTTTTTTVETIRNEFELRYGGKGMANEIYTKGIRILGNSTNTTLHATAQRILYSIANERKFVLSFAGYSVTVGRGNHFHQSYPFVVQKILQPLFTSVFQYHDDSNSNNNIEVIVRNSAIGGIPSFPYGFCFNHFLGIDSNVISWDYSMNENGKDASVLEAYIRQSQNQLYRTKPMIIILDTNIQRCTLVNEYISTGLLKDGICVAMPKDIMKGYPILTKPNETRPIGFQNWDEFGASKDCPGRGSWHPKYKEHELIGWIIAMYFVNAIEIAQLYIIQNEDWKDKYITAKQQQQQEEEEQASSSSSLIQFPPPFVQPSKDNAQSVTNLLYGHSTNDNDPIRTMHHISCRTNFLPALDEEKVLPNIVVSGLASGITCENIIEKRTDNDYNTGWVLDVSDVERDTKIKVNQCGGLGYIDMKIALYGISQSGTLRLWLPLESTKTKTSSSSSTAALQYFENLIICEANEKRNKDACKLDNDIEYIVGGVPVLSTTIKMISSTAEYLKRKTCVHIGIPDNAQITKLRDVQATTKTNNNNNDASSSYNLPIDIKRRLAGQSSTSTRNTSPSFDDDHVGIVVDINVKSTSQITRSKGACCISHVIWEEQQQQQHK